jgi:hypothetical protein
VLRGEADLRALRGRVVVVGASAPTLGDVHATPAADHRLMSGPEIQAEAIHSALGGLPLRSAPGWLGTVSILLLGALPALGSLWRRGWRGVVPAPVAGLAFVAAAFAAFRAGWVIEMAGPVVSLVLSTGVTNAAAYLSEQGERRRVAGLNEELEARVRERTEELRQTQLEVVQRLGTAAEWRDGDLGHHIDRISHLCERLGRALGFDPERARMLATASAMHDVGKIGVPDRVLLKPGRLDEEEWALMRSHTAIGAAILAGSAAPLLQMAERIARHHHERWDGSGYPDGLAGEAIPLEARICAICDVFDALLSARPYKESWSLEGTLTEIAHQRGRHFDPAVTDAFLALAPTLDDELLHPAAPPEPPASTAAGELVAR